MLKDIRQCFLNLSGSVMIENIINQMVSALQFLTVWYHLKALVVKNNVLHNFGFGKVSQIHKTFLMELQLFGWRHFSKTEVVQNTVLNH